MAADTHHTHDHDHEQCLKLFARLSEYLDKELDQQTWQTIDRHVRRCDNCRACLETLQRTVYLFRHWEDQPVPVSFSNRIRRLLREQLS